jgi:hypothetical protein
MTHTHCSSCASLVKSLLTCAHESIIQHPPGPAGAVRQRNRSLLGRTAVARTVDSNVILILPPKNSCRRIVLAFKLSTDLFVQFTRHEIKL